MKHIYGDIFDFCSDPDTDAICITTNGIVNNSGLACAGAGTAGEAASRWTSFRRNLGIHLTDNGNVPGWIGCLDDTGQWLEDSKEIQNYKTMIWSFPTKSHFKDPAIPDLIVQSAKIMVEKADSLELKKVIIPVPGCGKGQLNWGMDVQPLLKEILDDRFWIVELSSV